MAYAEEVKARVEALLKEKGLKVSDLVEAMGIGTSTYYDMWSNGYVTIDRIMAMAKAFEVSYTRLMPVAEYAEPVVMAMASEPEPQRSPKRYLEDRVEWLEAEVRKLKEKSRPR